jgi:hypothetical protein
MTRRFLAGPALFLAGLALFILHGEDLTTATRGVIALPRLVQTTAPAYRWTGTVPPGGVVEIQNINGPIAAVRAEGPDVEVTAVRTARRADPAAVRIEAVPSDAGVTICAMDPSPDQSPGTVCRPGGAAAMRTRQPDVRVTFTVRVPDSVRLSAHTVNGDVSAIALRGPVALTTINGAATFSTTAYGEARTVNGPIRAAFGTADWSGALSLQTVNGSITVDLPEGADTDIQARSVNGEISAGFPVALRAPASRRSLHARLGGGGRSLRLETVNGSVRLRHR